MIGAGAGLLVGHFLDRSYDMEEVAYFYFWQADP
jgi:hypothetical protein